MLHEQNANMMRTLPTNIHAEQVLLGSILINSSSFEQVNEFLKPEHFYEKLHQKIYHAIEILTSKELTATPITIKSMLERDPLYQEINGNEYIIKLTTIAMVVVNARDYGKIIYDLAVKRSLIAIGESIVNDTYNSTLKQSALEQLQEAENKLYLLGTEGIHEKGFVLIQDSIAQSLTTINRAMKNKEHVTGISTGLIDLDSKLSGFQNSDLVIIAGRPGMGKTAFAMNFAFNACKALQRKVVEDEKPLSLGFFSLEMSSEQLANRLLSMVSKIDSAQLRTGKVNEEEYNNLRKASIEFGAMQFFIDDTPALSISAIRTKARKLKRKHNLGILFIDYLQLLKGSTRVDNRVLEISEITQGLKALAKELNIPVVALAQLSRESEKRADKRPLLSDLRESGSIEQDADIVMLLYREEYYLLGQEPPNPGTAEYHEWREKVDKCHNVAEILIAKHRNGAIGNVQVCYENQYSRISNLEKVYRPNH